MSMDTVYYNITLHLALSNVSSFWQRTKGRCNFCYKCATELDSACWLKL